MTGTDQRYCTGQWKRKMSCDSLLGPFEFDDDDGDLVFQTQLKISCDPLTEPVGLHWLLRLNQQLQPFGAVQWLRGALTWQVLRGFGRVSLSKPCGGGCGRKFVGCGNGEVQVVLQA